MSEDRPDIFDPDNEILPLRGKWRSMSAAVGCLFIVAIVVFLIWFIAENSDPPDDQGGLFGQAIPAESMISAV